MWDAPSKHLQSEHAPSALYLKVRRPLRHAAATGRTWQNIVGWQLMHEAGASKLWKANTCLQALACTHLIFIHFPHFKTIQNRFKTKSLGVPSTVVNMYQDIREKGQEMYPVGPIDWNMLAGLVILLGPMSSVNIP